MIARNILQVRVKTYSFGPEIHTLCYLRLLLCKPILVFSFMILTE